MAAQASARSMKRYFGWEVVELVDEAREGWVFLQLTTMSAGSFSFPPGIASRGFTAPFFQHKYGRFGR